MFRPITTFLQHSSESELSEEEIDSGLLLVVSVGIVVSLGEDVLDLVSQLLSGFSVCHLVLCDNLLELSSGRGELSGDLEAGVEDVVVVDDLGEWLEGRSSLDLLLGHSLGNSKGCSLNTSNKSMGELLALLALVEVLDNDGLLACSSASKQDDDSTGFHAIKE